jgi:hypothetical protein
MQMVGYVINDETEERGKVYYRKVKIDDLYGFGRSSSKPIAEKKTHKPNPKRIEQYHVLDSIF